MYCVLDNSVLETNDTVVFFGWGGVGWGGWGCLVFLCLHPCNQSCFCSVKAHNLSGKGIKCHVAP